MHRLIINQRERTMKTIFSVVFLLLSSLTVNAHNGEDPAAEVAKKRRYVLQYQNDYQGAASQHEKIRNIKRQVSTLQSIVILLRNSLVKENKSVRAGLSKYDLDYLGEIKNSLKDMQRLLKQLEDTVEK